MFYIILFLNFTPSSVMIFLFGRNSSEDQQNVRISGNLFVPHSLSFPMNILKRSHIPYIKFFQFRQLSFRIKYKTFSNAHDAMFFLKSL